MPRAFYFYLVILLEGYVVLATELLAIRQLIPFVGSGTETIAIVIAAILMPLAVGYYAGGQFKRRIVRGKLVTIREKLMRNIINAAGVLAIGLSYVLLEVFFPLLATLGIGHRVLQATVYSLVFLVYPVYLLGQTVPLISNYFSKQNLSHVTGKILFCSTIGSFLGSIFSTLVLMTTIGVHNTIIVNMLLLMFAVLLLSRRWISFNTIGMAVILGGTALLNHNGMMQAFGVVSDNNYNIVAVHDVPGEKDTRLLVVNRSSASKYSPEYNKRFGYITYLEKTFIYPLHPEAPKSILVIGTGGFTFGLEDKVNDYTYVDIDPSLKEVSEKYFLKQKLGKNKHFVPQPAEAFLNSSHQYYDLILLDVYSNVRMIPFQLITEEFFAKIKSRLNDKGIMIFNAIASPNFNDRFSVKLDNTLHRVFPNLNRQVLGNYNGWNDKPMEYNVLYSYFHRHGTSKGAYTDDLNTYFLDR